MKKIFACLLSVTFFAGSAFADEQAEIAKQLSNPIASLISVPFQMDYNENIGAGDEGSQWVMNIQPVIPFTLNEEWNIISRTILPVIDQKNIPAIGMGETGIGDVVQSFFFSPQEPTSSGIIWGVGPVFLLPTAADPALGSEKWGIGPTGVALKQDGPWTYGALANHIESFAGEANRADISLTLLQPFLVYTTKTMTSIVLENQSTYDWKSKEWAVPINLMVKQMLMIGGMPLQIGAGARYWVNPSTNGAERWGARLSVTFIFPRM
jgi:hypothetical protein